MKIFIIGASGYIGRVVTEKALLAGHQVVALARSDEAAAKLPPGEVSIVRGDLADISALQEGVRQADAVIHLAIQGNRGPSSVDDRALETIIKALAGTDSPLIVTSGFGVYVGSPVRYIDEDTPLTNVLPAQAWRVQIEKQVVEAAKQGIRSVVIRPPFVYGRGSCSLVIRAPIEYARTQGKAIYIGDGTNSMPTVHVDDLANAYVQALDRAAVGTILNVVGGAVTSKDFARSISYAIGQGGVAVSLPLEEALPALGPAAAALAMDLTVSGVRMAHMLGWTPTGPSLLYEIIQGSLRP